jgi:hypothetical protein
MGPLELIFAPFVPHLVFHRRIERKRRPLDDVHDCQTGLVGLGPGGRVIQSPLAALTAIDAHKK